MIGDEDAYRRALRASADEDVAAFIESLDREEGRPPPPPRIEVSEVTGQPMEFDLLPFGVQGASTTPTQDTGGFGVPQTCVFISTTTINNAGSAYTVGDILTPLGGLICPPSVGPAFQ